MSTKLQVFRKNDILCIISVILVAVLFFLSSSRFLPASDKLFVKIDVNGKAEYYPLNVDERIEVTSNGITLNISIENGEVWVESTTCPDSICKTMGRLRKNGQMAICAPASVALSIRANSDSEVDADAITR